MVGHIVVALVIQVNGAISPEAEKVAILFARKISPAGFLVYVIVQLSTLFVQVKSIFHVKGTLRVNDKGVLVQVLPALSVAMTCHV